MLALNSQGSWLSVTQNPAVSTTSGLRKIAWGGGWCREEVKSWGRKIIP